MGKEKEVYAPGELSKTRDRLKVDRLDQDEAKRMTKLLGGEIGFERSADQETDQNKPGRTRNESAEGKIGNRRAKRHVEILDSDDPDDSEKINLKEYQKKKQKEGNPADNPSIPVRTGYLDRVRIDKYCGQLEFGIKSPVQVLISFLTIVGDPPDYVSPSFVNKRMNQYYKRIETLVTSVRSLLPRNNLKRNEQLKKVSPFAFSVIDTMRYWNIDQISSNLSRIQARPRNARVVDFTEILREIYKPLYILEQLDLETHIKDAFKLLYKVLFLENPSEPTAKYQELIRVAVTSFGIIRRDIRFQLYPMLMKLLSGCIISYEYFFLERKNRFGAFLQLSEENQISPPTDRVSAREDENEDTVEDARETSDETGNGKPVNQEESLKQQSQESKVKALDRGFSALETLFPKAGWDKITAFPDLYPYFSDVFKLKKGSDLIAPADPLQQFFILARILEELLFGLRYTNFAVIPGSEESSDRINDTITRIVNSWQQLIEASFEKEYLTRFSEYCRLLENSAESRTSPYAKKLLNELQWIKRSYFFPFYKFESIMPPPFQKNTGNSIYPVVRSLRRCLSTIAVEIEEGNRRGGAENSAPCRGIDNPWAPYEFQVPNPVSRRLDMLLAPKKRNNATLVFFTLAVTVVLDHLINEESSWAYDNQDGFLFRSENDAGIRPLSWAGDKVDAEQIFKQYLKKRQNASS